LATHPTSRATAFDSAPAPTSRALRADRAAVASSLVLYALLAAAYYFLNFVLRWSRYLVFSGHGVYGWPAPTPLQQLGILAGSFAGPLLTFLAVALIALLVARRHALWVLVPVAAALVCFAELDATWYSLAQEHVRLVDIELFFGLNVKAHLGVSASDMSHVVLACALHVLLLVAAGVAVAWIASRRGAWLAGRPSRVVFLTAAVLLVVGNGAAYGLSMDQAWQQISRSNRLNASLSALVHKTDPSGRLLQSKYAASPRGGSGPAPAIDPPIAPSPNASVIVIAIEGWNPAFVDDSMMPFVSQLRRQSRVFINHYSSGNNTLIGTLGLVYGESPTFYFDHAASGQRSLFIDALRDHGYRTAYFGEGLSSYRFIDGYLTNFTNGGNPVPVSDSAIHAIAAFVNSSPRTYTYYYYANTHFPYRHAKRFAKYLPEVPDDYQFDANDIRRSRTAIVNRYRNGLVEADDFLSHLFARLPWKKMIVVLTGDHGEAMLENGRLSHSSSLEHPEAGTPMSIYVPGGAPGVDSAITSHLDVFPTIFARLGIAPPPAAQGRDMFAGGDRAALIMHNNQNDRPVEAAIISRDTKMMVNLTDLRHPRFTGLLDTDDHPATIAGRDSAIQAGFARLRQILGADGCEVYDQAASHNGTPWDAIAQNLRHCRSGSAAHN
jgi:hypothetical protein